MPLQSHRLAARSSVGPDDQAACPHPAPWPNEGAEGWRRDAQEGKGGEGTQPANTLRGNASPSIASEPVLSHCLLSMALPCWSHPLCFHAILKSLIKTKTGTSRNMHQPLQVTRHSYYPFPHALFWPLPGWSISASFLISHSNLQVFPKRKLIFRIV